MASSPPLASCSRRRALARLSTGFGAVALSALLGQRASAATTGGRPKPHFAPRAKSVIFCYMSGGVSHVDSFDPKPRLKAAAGQTMPMTVERTQFNDNGRIAPSYWDFKPRGKSGLEVSDLFPRIGERADDLCVIRSMTSKFNEHAQGGLFLHTGFPVIGYPSAGAWLSYGLGSEAEDLPSYVVLRSGDATPPLAGVGTFGNGFLPAAHQGSILTADGAEPLPNLRPHEGNGAQRRKLDLINSLDQELVRNLGHESQVETAIQNYELAFRMQSSVPDLCQLAGESELTRRLYGIDDPDEKKAAYAKQCLVARRLVERGVRFVELSCLSYGIGAGNAGNPWDQHGDLEKGHGKMGNQIDQPIAALLADLKGHGLLDQTLVIWAGEFGRTPFSQGSNGRDHNALGFSIWMAGGGIKGGMAYGATDDYGYHAVDKPCDIYDLWATVLHQMGLDHEKLTYRYSGRDIRLTDVHGRVLQEILAG